MQRPPSGRRALPTRGPLATFRFRQTYRATTADSAQTWSQGGVGDRVAGHTTQHQRSI